MRQRQRIVAERPEVGVQHQVLRDAPGPHVRGVVPAIGLERAARLQQAHPLDVLADAQVPLVGPVALAELHLEEGSRGAGALDVTAELHEVPALAVRHGGVGDALEQVHAADGGGQEFVGARRPLALAEAVLPHVQEEPVDLLPHLGADLFAHLPGVLPRRADRRQDGLAIRQVHDRALEVAGGGRRRPRWRRRERRQQEPPVPRGVRRRAVERDVQVHVDHARRVLGPLEIPAHPVQAVRDPRQHVRAPPRPPRPGAGAGR